MKSLFAMILLANAMGSADGLAFVTSIMRTPLVPVAALRAINPFPSNVVLNQASTHSEVTMANHNQATGAAEAASPKPVVEDTTTLAQRHEMVDLVYARSLERMNAFASGN